MDDRLANRAEAIIAAHPLSGSHAKPLFLFLAPHSKHLPHDEPMVLEGCPAGAARKRMRVSGRLSVAAALVASTANATAAAEPSIEDLEAKVTDCEAGKAIESLDAHAVTPSTIKQLVVGGFVEAGREHSLPTAPMTRCRR